jgi:NAD(P)-dependent dehydrogenase (short-subunit alcohol dehydrogenase family)
LSKIILVTGGGRGIGAATCRLAAEQGYAVCVNYLKNKQAADALVKNLKGKAIAVAANVADERDVLRLFETLDRDLGRIDVLVNNAGILAPASRLENHDLARIQRLFSTNVFGAMLCAREAVRRMSTRHGGRGGAIVNLSTGFVKSGAPGMFLDYAASKGAIEVFTAGLARELATEGIRVNAPGAHRHRDPCRRRRPGAREEGRARGADEACRAARRGGARHPLARLRRRFLHHGHGARRVGRYLARENYPALCALAYGAFEPRRLQWGWCAVNRHMQAIRYFNPREGNLMNSIIYIVGLVVIVIAILGFLGLR